MTPEQRHKFPSIAPDFVLELRSPSDPLKDLQEKMQEYMTCRVRLGWLLNPQDRQVEIYRQRQAAEIVPLPLDLSGEAVLPGFELVVDRWPED